MAFTPKLYDDILTDMMTWVAAKTTKVTDFNDGSILKTLLSAVAVIIEETYYDVLLGWKDAMRYAIQDSLNFTRVDGEKAAGSVVFSRSTPAGILYSIPVGTVVATNDGVRFVTTVAGSITIGNTSSGSISILAEEVGVDGNVGIGDINRLVSIPAGIESVTNAGVTTGGTDAETDDEYNTRFQYYIQGLAKATPYGLKAGVLSVSGVKDTYIYEDTVSAPGYVTLFVDDGTGGASAGLLADVQNLMEGDGTSSNPGYRPAGITFSYQAAAKVTINVTATIYYDASADADTVKTAVGTAVSEHINGLKIGEDVVKAKLIDIIMGVVGVKDVSISVPASNTTINPTIGQIAKYGTGTYTMIQYTDLP